MLFFMDHAEVILRKLVHLEHKIGALGKFSWVTTTAT